jgi:hypothetical protein
MLCMMDSQLRDVEWPLASCNRNYLATAWIHQRTWSTASACINRNYWTTWTNIVNPVRLQKVFRALLMIFRHQGETSAMHNNINKRLYLSLKKWRCGVCFSQTLLTVLAEKCSKKADNKKGGWEESRNLEMVQTLECICEKPLSCYLTRFYETLYPILHYDAGPNKNRAEHAEATWSHSDAPTICLRLFAGSHYRYRG